MTRKEELKKEAVLKYWEDVDSNNYLEAIQPSWNEYLEAIAVAGAARQAYDKCEEDRRQAYDKYKEVEQQAYAEYRKPAYDKYQSELEEIDKNYDS